MASINQMIREGRAKVRDLQQVEYQYLEIIPELNLAGRTEENEQKDAELREFILNGGFQALPLWEVCLLANGNVGIVDCHRRHRQTGIIIAESTPEQLIAMKIMDKDTGKIWVPIKVVPGDLRSMRIRQLSSNTQKGAKPYQFAARVKELYDDGMIVDEIRRAVSVSRGAVEQALLFDQASPEVKALVVQGTIAATEVIKQVRQHKGEATKVITAAVEVAKAAGKTHVTAAAFVMPTANPRTEALRKALNDAHAMLAPLVVDGSLDNAGVKRLQGIVATGLRLGAAA